jgi:hypothetical protein
MFLASTLADNFYFINRLIFKPYYFQTKNFEKENLDNEKTALTKKLRI